MSLPDEVVHPEDIALPEPPLRDRLAARAADAASTVPFLLVNVVIWAVWLSTRGIGIDNSGFTLFTLGLSLEAIVLTCAVLIKQRLDEERGRRESDADLKNDAIAAEAGQKISDQLDRIEQRLGQQKLP